MKIDGKQTYWGMDVEDSETPKTKKVLGVDLELQTGGQNAEITEGREEALAPIQNVERGYKNARQTMLMYKVAHGSGVNPIFPSAAQIEEAMEGHESTYKVPSTGMAAKPHQRNGGQR